jgi:hypothetical protein
MRIGIFQALIFYAFGLSMAGLAYLIIGNPYIHAPGIHHVILIGTLLIGLIWTLISLGIFFFKNKTKKLIGVIVTNLVITVGFALYAILPKYLNYKPNPTSKESVKTEIHRDTTKIYHDENLVFLKVKDSVILDLR